MQSATDGLHIVRANRSRIEAGRVETLHPVRVGQVVEIRQRHGFWRCLGANTHKHMQMILLDSRIRQSVLFLSVATVDELLQLEPKREDLRTLRATLEELAIAPRSHAGGSGGIAEGKKAGERLVLPIGGLNVAKQSFGRSLIGTEEPKRDLEFAFRWCPPGKFTMGDG